ncbi:GGDEF domain-containing protein [Roseateles sp.]|uniref:GGDEF domain-containing protein n=1 Tax=Roseateles sp. TaxID=1971397 RepID=UPI0032639F09
MLAAAMPLSAADAADNRAAPSAPPVAQPTASSATPDPRLFELYLQSRVDPVHAAQRLSAWAIELPSADGRRVQALALAGRLLASRGDIAGAERLLSLLGEQQRSQAPAQPGELIVQAALEKRRGSLRRAERLLGEAVDLLGPHGPPLLRLDAMWEQAHANEASGDLDAALKLRHQLLVLSDDLGQPRLRSESRSSLANTLIMAQQIGAATAMNAEALTIAHEADEAGALARAHTIESFLRNEAGDREGERKAMLLSIVEAHRAGSREDEVLGMANLSDHFLLRGEFATALGYASQALPLSRAMGDRDSESVALLNSGLAMVSLHRLIPGLHHLDEARALLRRDGAERRLADLEAEAGGYLERAGYKREALAAYQRHRQLAERVAQRHQLDSLVDLQERFDSARRQQDLKRLQQENHLREARLHSQTMQQRVWAAVTLAGAVLLMATMLLLRSLRRQRRRITEHNDKLRHEGERDPLTGLANRRHLLQRMRQSGGSNSSPVFTGGMLLIDLDHFKRINDCHGHAAGDAVLLEIAQRLQASVRGDDLAVRWGGEEFLIVTEACTSSTMKVLTQRLLKAVSERPVELPQGPLRVTASIGFAAFPVASDGLPLNWEHAVELVDRALYVAKARGRNRGCGVTRLTAPDEEAFRRITGDLESAGRAGSVQLVDLLHWTPDGARATDEPEAA